MRKRVFSTSEGDFVLPDQWKELLGEDVLQKLRSMKSRLKQLGINSESFKAYARHLDEFNEWYNPEEQHQIGAHTQDISILRQHRDAAIKAKYGVTNPMQIAGSREKVKRTNIERYGVTTLLKRSEVREQLQIKTKEKYGVDHPFKREDVRRKAKESIFAKYGTYSTMSSLEVREKVMQTNLERYGHKSSLQNEDVHRKAVATFIRKYGTPYPNMLTKEELDKRILEQFRIILPATITSGKKGIVFTATCADCGRTFESHFNSDLKPTVCPFCNKSSTIFERSLIALFTSKFNVYPHFRPDWMEGREIDIYLPDLQVGFEINGAYTHNSDWDPFGHDIIKDREYHKHKSELCRAHGVRLYHIWEHWNHDLIFDMLETKFFKINKRIYARNCSFLKISSEDARDFLSENHLHGFTPANYYFALVNEGDIVSLMSFKRDSSEQLSLSRLCFKQGFTIVGGSQKLFKNALKQLEGFKTIVSYAYRDITPFPEDSVYTILGFNFDGFTTPGLYYYIFRQLTTPNGKILKRGIYSRQKFQTFKLHKNFGYPEDFTSSNLKDIGIYRLFNSGNLKFTYNI